MERTWMMIVLGILLVIGLAIAVISAILKKRENRNLNFKAFFIIGITWIPIGIATENVVFTFVGLVFLILGVTKKKEWKNQPKWEELSPAEKKNKIALIVFLSVILLLGIVFYLMARNQVN